LILDAGNGAGDVNGAFVGVSIGETGCSRNEQEGDYQ
jgi:hypothetical protein